MPLSKPINFRIKKARSIYPIADRNPFIPQQLGGSFGYRGTGWPRLRKRALQKAKYRSEVSGWPASAADLIVDHIVPFRIAHKLANDPINLRVSDVANNAAIDNAQTLREFSRLSTGSRRFE